MNIVLTEEMDSRQATLAMPFVNTINAHDENYASRLWGRYESGVRDGVRQVLGQEIEVKQDAKV